MRYRRHHHDEVAAAVHIKGADERALMQTNKHVSH